MNAPEVLPTPYDITPLPRFPFEPGPSVWIAVLLAVAAAFLLLWLWARRMVSAGKGDPYAAALSELLRIHAAADATLSQSAMARVSLLLRRLCGWSMGRDLASASQRELQRAREAAQEPVVQELLDFCMRLDALKFQPPHTASMEKKELQPVITAIERLGSARRSGS